MTNNSVVLSLDLHNSVPGLIHTALEVELLGQQGYGDSSEYDAGPHCGDGPHGYV